MTTLNYDQVALYIPQIKNYGVSEIARRPGQFIDQLKKVGVVSKLPIDWKRKREQFIARHLPQYEQKPTLRRALALIAWAYMPAGFVPEQVRLTPIVQRVIYKIQPRQPRVDLLKEAKSRLLTNKKKELPTEYEKIMQEFEKFKQQRRDAQQQSTITIQRVKLADALRDKQLLDEQKRALEKMVATIKATTPAPERASVATQMVEEADNEADEEADDEPDDEPEAEPDDEPEPEPEVEPEPEESPADNATEFMTVFNQWLARPRAGTNRIRYRGFAGLNNVADVLLRDQDDLRRVIREIEGLRLTRRDADAVANQLRILRRRLRN
jgi:hypothetical protein